MVAIMPYVEQAALYSQWNLAKDYVDPLNAQARVQKVKFFYCPSRRSAAEDNLSDPNDTANGDFRDGSSNPTIYPGALADYAACIGSPVEFGDTGSATQSDYWWAPSPRYPGRPSNGLFICLNDWDTRTGNRRYTLAGDCPDGLSNTLALGDKHVALGKFGLGPQDSSCYNGDKGASIRKAGPGAALARSPDETGTRFGSYHTGVVQFCFGDGSVRGLQTTIATTTLGLLASRNDGKPIDASAY